MDIHVQNRNFADIGLIENYDSLIWTDRYATCGDFELSLTMTNEYRKLIAEGLYFKIESSDRTMIPETFVEKGQVKITGRSLESILDRRVVEGSWTSAPTSLFDYMQKLLLFNISNYASAERRVHKLQISPEMPAGFSNPTAYEAVKYGENLYDTLVNLKSGVNMGFKIVNEPMTNFMVYKAMYGRDLTLSLNNYVQFAETLGNIEDVESLKSSQSSKNVAVVNIPPWDDTPGIGEIWRTFKDTGSGVPMDLARREIWTDASDLRKDITFNDGNKAGRASSWGIQELTKFPVINDVDFKLSSNNPYEYNKHYQLGDIVELIAPSGEAFKHRITEYIQSVGPSGISRYPTLTAI